MPGFHEGIRVGFSNSAPGFTRRDRHCSVFIPSANKTDKTGHRHGVVAFDGYTPGQNGLPKINRLNETAEKYGLLVLYPEAQRRVFGQAANVWNAPYAMARTRRFAMEDDRWFVKELQQLVQEQLQIDCWTGIGFSAGAQFCDLLAAEGIVNEVVSVCGTWVPDQPLPKPGVKLIAFIGGADLLLPHDKPGIHGTVQEHIMALLLMRRRARQQSNPMSEIDAYLAANKLGSDVQQLRLEPLYRRRLFGGGLVIEYFLPNGGHAWHGRLPVESKYSPLHGKVYTKEQFDTNEIFAHELGWDKLVYSKEHTFPAG
jgi:poly(3-hydroxybutyrate) depolymerase